MRRSTAKIPKPTDFKPDTEFEAPYHKAGKARCQGWNPTSGLQCMGGPFGGKKLCHGCERRNGSERLEDGSNKKSEII